MRIPRGPFVLFACLFSLGLAGCGGSSSSDTGGSSPTADASLLDGSYFVWGYTADMGMPPTGTASWGPMSMDGMGACNGTLTSNAAGTLSGPAATMGTYTVAGDRSTSLLLGASDSHVGWSNAAGTVVLGGSDTAMEVPGVRGLVKLGAGMTDASISGAYFIGLYSASTVLNGSVSFWGSASADGSGGGSATLEANFNNAINTGNPPSPFTYSVAPDGQTTWNFTMSGETLTGVVLEGGDLVLLVGDTVATKEPIVGVLVRKTSGASAATLSGTYQMIGIEGTPSGSSYTSLTGTIVSDGVDTLTATLTRNTDGVIGASGPDDVTYTAAADGSLTVDAMGNPLVGGFGPGGRFFVLAGPNAAMTDPGIYIGMRR